MDPSPAAISYLCVHTLSLPVHLIGHYFDRTTMVLRAHKYLKTKMFFQAQPIILCLPAVCPCPCVCQSCYCSDEPQLRRVQTRGSSGRLFSHVSRYHVSKLLKNQTNTYFTDRVRARDNYCMISGQPNIGAQTGYFRSFEAAHVFPYAREELWMRDGYSHWITDGSPPSE